ncbi:MAG TPA: amidase [Xanthomonadales bacterium]|nr:amidase [Xanthomonadales bacterium]
MKRREVLLAAAAGALQASIPSGAAAAVTATAGEALGELAELSLADASRQIRQGAVTSRELTLACLARTEVENPRINAFITVMREQALAQSDLLDAEARQGKFRSALHGIPIALKDAIDTAGTPTTAASAIFKHRIPEQDAEVVRRLRDAGAIIFAKANLGEFSLTPTGVTSYFGPTRNPWALDRVTGASSSGSGAAVAARMCFAALGTDSGGSVRIPAAWCGLVGLKPTDGLVSNRGIIPSVATLDSCGPMARSVEDVALVFGPMVGYDALDTRSVARPAEDYALVAQQSVQPLRVGVPRQGFYQELEPEIASSMEQALAVITGLTAGLREVTLPPETEAHDVLINIAEVCSYHAEFLAQQADQYQPRTRKILQWCMDYLEDPAQGTPTAKLARYIEAREAITRLRRSVDGLFTDYDVLVLPTLKASPPTIAAALQFENNATAEDPPMFSINNTATFNRLGLPALTVPCGITRSGLPIGLMICGPRFSEGRLLALGAAYQRATDWHEKRPAPGD